MNDFNTALDDKLLGTALLVFCIIGMSILWNNADVLSRIVIGFSTFAIFKTRR